MIDERGRVLEAQEEVQTGQALRKAAGRNGRAFAREKSSWSTWASGLLAGLLSAVAVLGTGDAAGQGTTARTQSDGADGSASAIESGDSRLIWYRYDHRTEDGQTIMPWKQFVATWPVACDEWNRNEARRVVIFTSFAPDTIMVQTPNKDARQEGTWVTEKMYPIDSRDLHLRGEWHKTLDIYLHVGRDRPAGLIEHERECFDRLNGLPALLLLSEATGAEPVRYGCTFRME